MTHTKVITSEQAYKLDQQWLMNDKPADGLRLVDYRRSGNRYVRLLCVPGNDNAPCYRGRIDDAWELVSGPTLDEWQMQYDARDQSEYGVNEWQYDAEAMQSEYRDEAGTTAGLLQF